MGNVFSFLLTLVLFGVACIFIASSAAIFELILPFLMFGGIALGLILYFLDKNKK